MGSTKKIISTAHSSKKSSSINKSKSIRDLLKLCSFNSCVLFDFDNTLGQPKNKSASDEMFKALLQYAALHLSKEEAIQLAIDICHATLELTSMQPVEPKTTRVVHVLQDVNIPTLLVTARGPDLIETTEKQLKEIDIDFSKVWPEGTFELKIGNNTKPAVYHHGKIFCNGNSKALCIKAFFDHINYHPQHIVMVDDTVDHLHKTDQMINEHYDSRFDGIHYGYLDDIVEQFKQNFKLEKIIPELQQEISELREIKHHIFIRAKYAIDKLTETVSQQSIFFHQSSLIYEATYTETHTMCAIKA